MNENPENWQCPYAAFALHLFYMTQLSTGLDFNLRHYGISLEVYEIYEFDRCFFRLLLHGFGESPFFL